MSKVSDYHLLDSEYLVRYEAVVKTNIEKIFVFTLYILSEIYFTIQTLPRTFQYIYIYLFEHYFQSSGFKIYKDVRYSKNRPRNYMDIYQPNSNSSDNPVVVFIHGGTWGFGSKLKYIKLGKRFAKHGITTVIANYTLARPGNIENQLEDCDELFNYLKLHLPSYGGSVNDVTVMGHSAGGHILMLYLLTTYIERIKNKNDSLLLTIRNYIGLAAPFDINDHFIYQAKQGIEHFSPMKPNFGGIAGFKKGSPTCILEERPDHSVNDLPPIYLLTGNDDSIVPHSSSVKLFDILQRKSTGFSQLLEYDKTEHVEIILLVKDDENANGSRRSFTIKNGSKLKRDKQSVLSDILQIIKTK